MSKFKNNPNFTLYYTDTDSLFIDGDLDSQFLGKSLGQWKLEHIFKDCLFLAPKVYAGITMDDKLIVKIKGLSHDTIERDVTFDKLLILLNKDKYLVFNQIKSFRNFGAGSISLLEQTYNLIPTESKRQIVYKEGVFVGTKPYVINSTKEIK